jgi:hypothetical protein
MKDAISRELKLALALSPIAIPIGIVLVYLVLAVLMGSLGDAFTLILASIICTALISLIIWIPLWYIVGYGALLILRLALKPMGVDLGGLFAAKKTAPDKPPAQAAEVRPAAAPPLSPQGLTNDQMALLNYVGKARRKGLTDAQISHNLEKNGWSGESITAAFQMLKSGA